MHACDLLKHRRFTVKRKIAINREITHVVWAESSCDAMIKCFEKYGTAVVTCVKPVTESRVM